MNMTHLIIGAIVFIIAGIAFCAVAVFLGLPSSVQKAKISKPASIIFYVIGALTLCGGILALCFKSTITKTSVQLFAIIYLVILTVLFSVFMFMINGSTKK